MTVEDPAVKSPESVRVVPVVFVICAEVTMSVVPTMDVAPMFVDVTFAALNAVAVIEAPVMLPAYRLVPVAPVKFSVVTVVDAALSVPVRERPVPVAPENPRFVAKREVEVTLVPTIVVPVMDVPLIFVDVTDVTFTLEPVMEVAKMFVEVTEPMTPVVPVIDAA